MAPQSQNRATESDRFLFQPSSGRDSTASDPLDSRSVSKAGSPLPRQPAAKQAIIEGASAAQIGGALPRIPKVPPQKPPTSSAPRSHETTLPAKRQIVNKSHLPPSRSPDTTVPPVPPREVDRETRERIGEHVRWWMARHQTRVQARVVEKTGLDDSTVTRVVRATFRSLGLEVFLALHRRLDIDAEIMLETSPNWDLVPREFHDLKRPDF